MASSPFCASLWSGPFDYCPWSSYWLNPFTSVEAKRQFWVLGGFLLYGDIDIRNGNGVNLELGPQMKFSGIVALWQIKEDLQSGTR